MWSRRTFLEHGSLALAAMTCLSVRAAGRQHGPLGRPIGLQLYTVREAIAKDLPGTLRQLAAIGYREVELADLPAQPVAEMKALLEDCGLTAPSMHASMVDLQTGLQQRIDYAKGLGVQYLVCSFPWTSDARFRNAPGGPAQALASGMTLDDWKWNAEQLNRIGEITNKAGLRCGYHNHNMEFRSHDGVVAYDELLRATDPALVAMELDIAWVVTAGVDPLHYLSNHADRISLLHVKEVRKNAQTAVDRLNAQTTEVGSGQIDWRRLFAAMSPDRIRHYFVEQENFERPPLEAVKVSFEYLRRLEVSREP
ncbi:MAG: sugar phosphate isomerase/epimerase family protein [Steroidobacter sp.]